MEAKDLLDGKKLAILLSNAADLISLGECVLDLPSCNDCAKSIECEYVPKLGAPSRFNCPLWAGRKEDA